VCQVWSSPRQIGTLDHTMVKEASGMAVSRAYSDRLYHINDSGDVGAFFISNYRGGNTKRVEVTGFTPRDTEDMAYGSYGGKNYIMIGDIGDNSKTRFSIRLVVIEEKATFGASVTPAFNVQVRYPDGPHNAEAMALHPNGDLYIFTKNAESRIYRLTAAQWRNTTGQAQILQKVGTFGLQEQTGSPRITAADISPDGRRILFLTYTGAVELEARLKNGVLDFSQYGTPGGPAYKLIPLIELPQQESASYLPNGHDFIYTSEHHSRDVPILRLDCLG
jgi:hypothetical protein